MIKTAFAIAVLAAAGLSVVPPAFGQADDKALGTVHFETSCNPEAQKSVRRRNALSAFVLAPAHPKR